MTSDTYLNNDKRHNLDRRATDIAAAGPGDDDELLTTGQMAAWFGVSTQWLEIGRSKRWGPPFIRLGPRRVRYPRGPARQWLVERTYRSTLEYATAGGAGKAGRRRPRNTDQRRNTTTRES